MPLGPITAGEVAVFNRSDAQIATFRLRDPNPGKSDLHQVDASLPERIGALDRLDEAVAERALRCALEFACQAKHIANILLGRAALVEAPRPLVLAKIVPVARSVLDLRNAWEVRRFLEVLWILDIALLRAFASELLTNPDAEIREAAEDLLEMADDAS